MYSVQNQLPVNHPSHSACICIVLHYSFILIVIDFLSTLAPRYLSCCYGVVWTASWTWLFPDICTIKYQYLYYYRHDACQHWLSKLWSGW